MRVILLIATCSTVSLGGCIGPPPEVHEGEYPVARIRRSADGNEASAFLASGVAIGEVLDISPFEGFRPGMTPAEAEALHGRPVQVRKSTWEDTCQFESGDVIVEVVARKAESERDSRILTRYVLRHPVGDPGYADLLPSSIRSLCTSAGNDMQLTVVSGERGDPIVRLNVRNGRVESIVLGRPIPVGLRDYESLPES